LPSNRANSQIGLALAVPFYSLHGGFGKRAGSAILGRRHASDHAHDPMRAAAGHTIMSPYRRCVASEIRAARVRT
jgi:hypothetical protein